MFVHSCSVQLECNAYVATRTTDDECTCHATLAACYQLAQSVLKVCASENGGMGVGIVMTCCAHGSCHGWL